MVGLKYLFLIYMQNKPQNKIKTLVNSAEISAVLIGGDVSLFMQQRGK